MISRRILPVVILSLAHAGPITAGEAPAVESTAPVDGATDVALDAVIEVRWDRPPNPLADGEALRLITLVGEAVPGRLSLRGPRAVFRPERPLAPRELYELVLADAGATTSVFFETGPPAPVLDLPPAARTGAEIAFRVRYPGADGERRYRWRPGDGSGWQEGDDEPAFAWRYQEPGHYLVQVQALGDGAPRTATTGLTVHPPLGDVRPEASSPILYDAARDLVWCVAPDNDHVAVIDAASMRLQAEIAVGAEPRSLALGPDATVWVVEHENAAVAVIDAEEREVIDRVSLPRACLPFGIATTPDRRTAYVATHATGELLRLDLVARRVAGRLQLGGKLRGVAVGADAGRVLVTRFISPADRAEVIVVDADDWEEAERIHLAPDPGPDTEDRGRGVLNYLAATAIRPDGGEAWLPAKKDNTLRGLARDGLPLTFESTVRASLARLDLRELRDLPEARRDLNDRDLPSAVAFSPLGDYAFVTTRGTNTCEVFDAYTGEPVASVPTGRGPEGIAVDGDGRRLFVHEFLDRRVAAYDLEPLLVAGDTAVERYASVTIVTEERLDPQVLAGKRIFGHAGDPRMSRDHYISCASCHLDGDNDARVWDFTDRGEGLRNTIELRGRAGTAHGPVHWTANFDEIQDFEHDIRGPFGGTGFLSDADFARCAETLGEPKAGRSAELDALAAYVSSLDAVHPSPHRAEDGSLTADGGRGREIFERLGCHACHGGEHFTDSPHRLRHDLGSAGPDSGGRLGGELDGFDTPTLRGVWETPPYLHDGSAADLAAVFERARGDGAHGAVAGLAEGELADLLAFLRQIDEREPGFETSPAVHLETADGPAAFRVATGDLLGAVERIELLRATEDGVEVIATATESGRMAWDEAPAGTHRIHARVAFAGGVVTTTAPLTCTIEP